MIADRRARHDEAAFVVQGRVLVSEAIESGLRIRFILCRVDSHPDFEPVDVARAGDIEMFGVEASVFDALNDTSTPQGMLAVCDIPEPGTVDRSDGWWIVAHSIADPGNLGTIIRSAEASGAFGVVVTRGTVDPFSPKCVRASAGALFRVPVIFVADLEDSALESLELVGTTSHEGPGVDTLWDADLGGRLGIVLGAEAHGLAEDEAVHRWIRIPHAGRAESLNVAMAATVIAMHVGRSHGSGRES